MIDDLSKTLRALLQQPGGPKALTEAHVVFDQPLETFKPAEPTLDLFLYDIRENTELRGSAPVFEPRDGGRVAIARPPLRLACSYLLTAWPSGGGELPLLEQQLLGMALLVLRRYPAIPAALLQGGLKAQALPVPLSIGQPAGLKDPHEFWAAIGNRLRPSITITATLALEVADAAEEAPLVSSHEIRLAQRPPARPSSP